MGHKVIDYSVTPPLRGFLLTPQYAEDYALVYGRIELQLGKRRRWTEEGFIEFLEAEGIAIAVIKARDAQTTQGLRVENRKCAQLVARYPGKLIGMAGVDPLKGKAAVDELKRAVNDYGLKGVNLWPYEYRLYPHDPIFYPVYEKAQELGVVVSIETSIHFDRSARMDLCRPLYLDYVAVDFPELKLVGSTPGWPWVAELMGVAWRHPNVYVATSVVRPKYFAKPGSGYDSLLAFGDSLLKSRIIFGSGWPRLPISRSVDEINALPLKPEVKKMWLYQNAARLFDLSGGDLS